MTEKALSQIPGVYHRMIGEIAVTAISDGYFDGDLSMMRDVAIDAARTVLDAAFRPPCRISVNTFLINSNGRLAIIDTGSGNNLAPTVGRVLGNLSAAGVAPSRIDTVLLTHIHPDHSGGLTDITTGKSHFPNAELAMHENESRHWLNDAEMAKAGELEQKLHFQAAREQVASYKSRTRLFASGEVFPGVFAVPSAGHTPGHTAYLVASGSQQLMIWGDTVHVPEVQVAYPEAGVIFDTDPTSADAARRRMFDRVAADKILVAGMHLHYPSFCHLAREGDAYRLYPEPWVHEL